MKVKGNNPLKPTLTFHDALLLAPLAALPAADQTGVSFQTSDADLQRLYDAAEAKVEANIVQFTPTMKVLVEGGGYRNASAAKGSGFKCFKPESTART
jgi:hypothetical protein